MASKFAASEIYDLTECPVCIERFSRTRAPKILSCTHTLCVQCMRSIVQDQRLLCPVCRGTTDVPQGDVTKITTNLTVLQLAELQPLTKCQECGYEKKNSKCFHCEKKICGKCLGIHTEDTQAEIGKMRDQLKNSEISIQSFQESLGSRISLFKADATRNIHQIRTHFRILENKLNQRRDTLIAKVNEFERTTEQEYSTIKTVVSKIQAKISSVLSEVQTSLPNVEQHHTKRSIDNLRDTCPQLMKDLNNIALGCKVTFPRIWTSTHIDAVQREIEKWGTVTSDEGVTVLFNDAGTVPIDYTQRGWLVRRLVSWGKGSFKDGHKFASPTGVDVDPVSGEMFVADNGQHQVHVFTASGQHVRSFGGMGSELGQFQCPIGVCINHSGEVIVCDCHNHRCEVFTPTGVCSRVFGQHGSGEGALSRPTDVTVDDNDNMFVTSHGNHCVKVYNKEGSYIWSFGKEGRGPGQFESPVYIQWSRSKCFVCDDNGVQLWSDGGDYIRSIGAHTNSDRLIIPQGVAADQHGNILVMDVADHTVKVYSSEGEFITKLAVAECKAEQDDYCFITCTSEGSIIVSDIISESLLFY